MKQSCNLCSKEIETGGFGGLPMKQHYKSKHPEEYYSDDSEESIERNGRPERSLEEIL